MDEIDYAELLDFLHDQLARVPTPSSRVQRDVLRWLAPMLGDPPWGTCGHGAVPRTIVLLLAQQFRDHFDWRDVWTLGGADGTTDGPPEGDRPATQRPGEGVSS